MGEGAVANNTTGSYNTGIGRQSLVINTTGYENTGCGFKSLMQTTTGYENAVVGALTAQNLTTGYRNAVCGKQAMDSSTTAHNNACLGFYAGGQMTTGSNNILLGTDGGTHLAPSGSVTTQSNIVNLGNNNITDLFCADTSISSSDARDKTDVSDFTIGLDWIKACRPVTYRWDKRTWYATSEEPYGTPDGSKKSDRLHIGFLAQEMLAIEKANGYGNTKNDSLITINNCDEMSYGIKYERLVPVLVNAIKELETRLAAVEAA